LSNQNLVDNGGHWKTEYGCYDNMKALYGLELDYVGMIGGYYCRNGF